MDMGMDDMNSGTTTAAADMEGMMIPYLHFGVDGYLYLKRWQLNSNATVALACIGVLVICFLERRLAAARFTMEVQWKISTTVINAQNNAGFNSRFASGSPSSSLVNRYIAKRSFAPFIPRKDLTRGAVHTAQTSLGYLIMLAVMTFNAALIITVLLGLSLGEVLFGRVRNSTAHTVH